MIDAELAQRIHALGAREVAPHADAVDRDARFPEEALAALRAERLLSCYVPPELGGMGLDLRAVSRICEILGQYCGSTAMVFAMHQIQVACIVHHALDAPFFQDFCRDLVERQLLLASATTELGIGGNLRTSNCAVEIAGDRYRLHKQAPVISYGAEADAILATCRRAPDAAPGDQAMVLVMAGDARLKPLSGWDTLGFRGTCSLGFELEATGDARQVFPVPYAEVHEKTMYAFSHCTWSALWLGIATDAVNRARRYVRAAARKTPGTLPPSALRLAEVDGVLFSMASGIHGAVAEYQAMLDGGDDEVFSSNFAFAVDMNNLKVRSSELVVDVVGRCLLICGISGYRNDSRHSLARQLRDAYGAAVMVNNDRILGQSSSILLVRRDR